MIVKPLEASGYSFTFLGLFGAIGPTWDVVCGNCFRQFNKRLDAGREIQELPCPRCGAVNVFRTEWEDD